MKYSIRTLSYLFPSIVSTTTSEAVHLTFDDGPHPDATSNILNILNERGINATFFLLGKNAKKYPDLVQRIKSEGHQIANHSYTHSNLLLKRKNEIEKDIIETKHILEDTVGIHSPFFRPPYGYFDLRILKILKELGMTCVLWSINSKDFKLNSNRRIADRVIRQTASGSIILFHDNNNTAMIGNKYLAIILDTLLEKMFTFRTL